MKQATLLLILFCAATISLAQKVKESEFKKYPAPPVHTGKKAPINFNSNPAAKSYRTALKEGYKQPIDFAGNYVTVQWGAGAGLSMGAMIDARDGKVYDLPLDESNSISSDKIYNSKSRLFVIQHCEEDDKDCTSTLFKWDEAKKKFIDEKGKPYKMYIP